MLKHELIDNKTGRPVKMYNLIGRTEKQQEAIEVKLEKQGCLWGRADILNQFIFTKTELNAVERAKETIKNRTKKLHSLI